MYCHQLDFAQRRLRELVERACSGLASRGVAKSHDVTFYRSCTIQILQLEQFLFQPQSHFHNPATKYRKVRSTYLPANLRPPTQSIERPSGVLSRRWKPNPIDRHRMGKDNKPLRAFWLAVKGKCEQVKTRPEKVLPLSFSQAKLRFAVLCSLAQLIILCCWYEKSPSSTMVQPGRTRPTVTFLQIGEQGRLGNQIFQIAATIGLTEKHGYAWGFFPNIKKSAVGRLFQLRGTLVPGKDLIDLQYNEKSEIYYDAFLPVGSPTSIISLTGYFQDYRYFVNHLDVLNNCLNFPGSMIRRVGPEVRSPFTVALHVRRGDYLKSLSRHTCTPYMVYGTGRCRTQSGV